MKITICNGKGGVGKTTVTVLLAAALHRRGISVSIDDRDPQGSATQFATGIGLPLGSDAEVVLIDTAPNLEHPGNIDAYRDADKVVLVTTPFPVDLATSIRSAHRIVEIRGNGKKCAVMFNNITRNTLSEKRTELAKLIPFQVLSAGLKRRTPYQMAPALGWKVLDRAAQDEVEGLLMRILALA